MCSVLVYSSSMANAIPSTELLQSIILHELENGSIKDTRELPVALRAAGSSTSESATVGPSTEAQGAVKGALDSLAVKEVCYHSYWSETCAVTGRGRWSNTNR